MLSDEEKEIFNNLKEYMQNQIDNGYHKFIYNDLDWDFKCIDCINAIDNALKQSKEIEELKADKYGLEEEVQIQAKQLIEIDGNYISKEESEQKERKAYIKGTNDAHELCNKKWKDKIKAKIEDILNSENSEAIEKLIEWQSLLEKE